LNPEHRNLTEFIFEEEKKPVWERFNLDDFLAEFRQTVINHQWEQLHHFFNSDWWNLNFTRISENDPNHLLNLIFQTYRIEEIADIEYTARPDQLELSERSEFHLPCLIRTGKKNDRIDTNLYLSVRKEGPSKLSLFTKTAGITNYIHRRQPLINARSVSVQMESFGDPYVRCYSAWIEDGSGGYINLNGGSCSPDTWKSTHCSCPTVSGRASVSYDFSAYTSVPYTGKFIFAISSYLGFWTAEIRQNPPPPFSHADSLPFYSSGFDEALRLLSNPESQQEKFYLGMLPDVIYRFIVFVRKNQTLTIEVEYWRGADITITSGSADWKYSGPGGEAPSAVLSVDSVPRTQDYEISIRAIGFPRSENIYYPCTIRRK